MLNVLYQKVHSHLVLYGQCLPRFTGYDVTEKAGQVETRITFSINDQFRSISLILEENPVSVPSTEFVQNLSENIPADAGNCSLCKVVKKVLLFISTPFRWIYAFFHALYEEQISKQNAYLDRMLSHFQKPQYSENWVSIKEGYAEEFRAFTLKWPFINSELSSKQALIHGLFALSQKRLDEAKKSFEKAALLAPNDSLRLFAYAGIYTQLENLIHLQSQDCDRDWIKALQRKKDETLQKMRELQSITTAIQADFYKHFISPTSALFADYRRCYSNDFDTAGHNKLGLDLYHVLYGLGPLNAAIGEAFFPETMATLWNVSAHWLLFNLNPIVKDLPDNPMLKEVKRLDVESYLNYSNVLFAKAYSLHPNQVFKDNRYEIQTLSQAFKNALKENSSHS